MFPIVNLNLFLILYASKLLKRIPFFSRDFFIIFDYRVRNKISPTVGGTDHISHRLLNLGLSETKTLSMFFIYSFICFGLISISALQGSMISFSIYLFILFATFIYVRKLEILN